jgi:hypothetical protein
VVVGLSLGPRKGYDVAVLHTAIPSTVSRSDFRRVGDACHTLYNLAAVYAEQSFNLFRSIKLQAIANQRVKDELDRQAGC